jgi:uncharacterized protein YndB with AHSA1/START domain
MTDLSLTARRTIKAAPETVFNAWLDPAKMSKFLFPRDGMHVREARADARVGGRFHVMMVGDKDYPHEGTYREITPHSRLVFTWEAPWSAPETYVTIDFKPVAGGTDVTLTHVKFVSEESRDNHLDGWTGILAHLDALVA